jgi:hypothetical protein
MSAVPMSESIPNSAREMKMKKLFGDHLHRPHHRLLLLRPEDLHSGNQVDEVEGVDK